MDTWIPLEVSAINAQDFLYDKLLLSYHAMLISSSHVQQLVL